MKQFSMHSQDPQITTPYNDNDTENNNLIDDKKIFKESGDRSAYKGKVIPVDRFYPETYEEEKCWEIAKSLGETDMRFILSCLKNLGFGYVEEAWDIVRERPAGEIRNKRKYFNKIVRDLAEQKNP